MKERSRNWNDILIYLHNERGSYVNISKLRFEARKRNDVKEVSSIQLTMINSFYLHIITVNNITDVSLSLDKKINLPLAKRWLSDNDKVAVVYILGILISNPHIYKPEEIEYFEVYDHNIGGIRWMILPSMFDQAVMHRYNLITYPVVEFGDTGSFGCRGRSAYEPIHILNYGYLNIRGAPKIYYHIDVSKCITKINPGYLLNLDINEPCKPLRNKMLETKYYLLDGNLVQTMSSEINVNVNALSKIISNAILNGREDYLVGKGLTKSKHIELFRVFNEIVVTLPDVDHIEEVHSAILEFIAMRGLDARESEVDIGDIRDGLNFRGWNLRRKVSNDGSDSNYDGKPKMILKPSKKSIQLVKKIILKEIEEEVVYAEKLIKNRNCERSNWCSYFETSYHSKKTIVEMEKYLYGRIKHWYGLNAESLHDDAGFALHKFSDRPIKYPKYVDVVKWDQDRRYYPHNASFRRYD